ncbi:CinA family protein [Kozakia baliensis]|uniref:CinA family protein n=1 Tax=Kozakia baliensis TaxID=153496 RepID=UPI0004965916|nr:CinA family protein [Kozakia baliensis]
MLSDATLSLAAKVVESLRARGLRVVTAESCTGGLIAAALTHVAGSSDVVEGGFVTYSNILKETILDVSTRSLAKCGAVSEAVAVEMAMGALTAAENARISVAVTGIAGPDGGSVEKPVGTVCLARQCGDGTPYVETKLFQGNRAAVRAATVQRALELLLE